MESRADRVWVTCFLHPRDETETHALGDSCPICEKAYSFPLDDHTDVIDRWQVLEPLGRGFYGAAYRVEPLRGIGEQRVLKVIPRATYELFEKDAEGEFRRHIEVARASQHLVRAFAVFEADVQFRSLSIPCWVFELELVEGVPLVEAEAVLRSHGAPAAAQIALDLVKLLWELGDRASAHNDLHARNIYVRTRDNEPWRNEFSDEVRVIALDLGAVASYSDSDGIRRGDCGRIGEHLQQLAESVLALSPSEDRDHRIASALDSLGYTLNTARSADSRPPSATECQDMLDTALKSALSPWTGVRLLRTFEAGYNANLIEPQLAGQLLVSPEGADWVSEVSSPGPLLVTGMRGCGKTLLLRALEIHSRLHVWREGRNPPPAVTDDFVALYVSCGRLVDVMSVPGDTAELKPFCRLLVAYARQAIRAVRHFTEEVGLPALPDRWWDSLVRVVHQQLGIAASVPATGSPVGAEHHLQRLLTSREVFAAARAPANPAEAFLALSQCLRALSETFSARRILFLLDDLSPRYLADDQISRIASVLHFMDPDAAFKVTSEAQTVEFVLKSPGLIRSADLGRDYITFSLGERVLKVLADPEQGPRFIASVLARRLELYAPYSASPSALLGTPKRPINGLRPHTSQAARASPAAAPVRV